MYAAIVIWARIWDNLRFFLVGLLLNYNRKQEWRQVLYFNAILAAHAGRVEDSLPFLVTIVLSNEIGYAFNLIEMIF